MQAVKKQNWKQTRARGFFLKKQKKSTSMLGHTCILPVSRLRDFGAPQSQKDREKKGAWRVSQPEMNIEMEKRREALFSQVSFSSLSGSLHADNESRCVVCTTGAETKDHSETADTHVCIVQYRTCATVVQNAHIQQKPLSLSSIPICLFGQAKSR